MFESLIGAGISAIGSLAGGALSSSGAAANNAANIAAAQQMAQFNAAEAAKNRDWQERMSNTAYQRAMADMRLAGLNPMLAYQQGGAGTPGGAQGSGSAPHLENALEGLGRGFTSAAKGGERALQLQQVQADTEQKYSTADMNKAATLLNNANTARSNQETATSAAQAQKLAAETANVIASADNPAAMKAMYEGIANQNNSAATLARTQNQQLQEFGPGKIGQETSGIVKVIRQAIGQAGPSQRDPATGRGPDKSFENFWNKYIKRN